jgi:hypothetical protein
MSSAVIGSVVGLSDDALLAALVEHEAEDRRRVHHRHALIAEAEARGVARERGMRSTAVLLSRMLRINPGEARARVAAAADLGPRRGLTGEPLEPIYPLVAAAQADGAISAAHAKVIVDTVEALPDAVRAEQEEQVEADLVGYARRFDPLTLGHTARRISALLDPDGILQDAAYRHRRRYLDLHRRVDGSAHLDGELDGEAAEYLQVVLDTLAGPNPATDGTPDPRTAGQRRHDALLDLCHLAMRARVLPTTGGVTTTVVLLASVETFESEDGLVSTGTGALIPASEARRWASSDSRFYAALIDKAKTLTSYSSGTRLFTETQRLALIARDRGCSFPGCTTPPALCQAHHILDWVNDGPTCVENGTLLCGFHHREFAALGWTCQPINGIPHWTAPAWLDQTPQRNHAHDPIAVT